MLGCPTAAEGDEVHLRTDDETESDNLELSLTSLAQPKTVTIHRINLLNVFFWHHPQAKLYILADQDL